MSKREIGILAAVLLVVVIVFARPTQALACRPHPVPVAGWKLPFSVTIEDSVVSWQPNQHAAQKKAVQVAYDNPDTRIRVASITEMVWRLRDGSPCESTWRPTNEGTLNDGGREWSAKR